ncbi:DNA gyrase subunit A (plasmid) [Clostridium tetani]|uniref:DNA gyrase/topoisomerase IV subunit A n=1 Tax=Clostridium tetani TaxID=1513 RepID=UPI002952CB85|nr:DNA topoisomerase (ATP-hydrolyzing) subunit A [Clostridium tetani]BDR74227.1 DNA gyrase subunit A [Clostridium tetani]
MYIDKEIEDIIESNMMGYSQYVIKNRALPDLYSGMKPIHLKILWSMYENKTFNFTKSANVSGKVMVYSPHGDCYETIVNMVQKDRHKYNLIEGQGNWGSHCSTDMQYAASRYTECKLSPLGIDCMEGIFKNMVEMIDNYDNSHKMPKYLPTKFPLILCMASSGIAVGMANDSPSFNLEDVCNATISYLQGEQIPLLIPDFATGGYLVYDEKEIKSVNSEGKGRIKLRAKYKIEGNTIIINEIPYGITVESIIDKIINEHKKGKLKEITNVLNQTGIKGLSIEITCKKGTDLDKLMAKLYTITPLESYFNVNMNILLKGSPIVLGVHDTIKEWIKFRMICISNGIKFDISKMEKELHLLRGLKKILLDIDKAISIIRHSKDIEKELMEHFNIDNEQANYIINMKLRNINKNYIIKQISDIEGMESKLKSLKDIINDSSEINKIIIKDLKEVMKKFSKPRMSQIIHESKIPEVQEEDFIEDYNCKILYTKQNYIKKLLRTSDDQKLRDGDEIIEEIQSTNKSTLLLFTNKANRYKISCHELGTHKPSILGEYIPNIIDLEQDEEVIKIISLEDETKANGYIISVYENGRIAKIDIQSYISANKKLQNCYSIKSKLIDIFYTEKDVDIFLLSKEGKGLILNTSCFNSKKSKDSQGDIAINLQSKINDNKLIDYIVNPNKETIFTINTEKNNIECCLGDIVNTGNKEETRAWYDYLVGKNRNKGNYIYNCKIKKDFILGIDNHIQR